MTKLKKLRMSHEARSEINRENALKGVAIRRALGKPPSRRGKSHPMDGMPLKHVAMYTADYIVYHRYAQQQGLTKLDLLHELIAPLKAKLRTEDY